LRGTKQSRSLKEQKRDCFVPRNDNMIPRQLAVGRDYKHKKR